MATVFLPDSDPPRLVVGADKSFRPLDLLLYSIVLVVFAFNVTRACRQSITTDEALTYNWFVSRGWKGVLFRFHSNNHTFHSMLALTATKALGLSHFALRFPALAGGLLYLLASLHLSRKTCSHALTPVLLLLALSLNPFITDYLVVSRGYALAMGFFFSALFLTLSEIRQRDAWSRPTRRVRTLRTISALCALSVASNLSFAIVNFSLLAGAVVVLSSRERRTRDAAARRRMARIVLSLAIPAAIMYPLANPSIFGFRAETLNFGTDSWSATWRSLIDATFGGFAPRYLGTVWSGPLSLAVKVLTCVLLGIALLHVLLSLLAVARRESAIPDSAKTSLFVCGILALTFSIHSAAHWAFNLPLPKERTGIYFIPLMTLSVAVAVDSFLSVRFRRAVRILGRGVAAVIVAYWLSCLHVNHFQAWRANSGARDVFLSICSLPPRYTRGGVEVNESLKASLEFYRAFYKPPALPVFEYRKKPEEGKSAYVLLCHRAADREFLRRTGLRVFYRHPLSNAVVAIKRESPVGKRSRPPRREARDAKTK